MIYEPETLRSTIRGWYGKADRITYSQFRGEAVVVEGYSCGTSDSDLEASSDDIRNFCGKSSLSPIEQASVILLRNR